MLVLKRKEGQWVEITHSSSGDQLRIRLYDLCGGHSGRANLAFDDPARNFEIQRPERFRSPNPSPSTPSDSESHEVTEPTAA